MGLPTEGQRCPKCGASAESNSSFCTACGNALLRSRCENCAEPLSEGAGFCVACGTPVSVGKSTSNQIPDQQARIDSTPPLVNSHVVYEAAAQEEGSEEASCPLELGPDERRLGTYSVGSILDPKVGGQLYLTTKRLALVWSPPKSQAVRTCSIPLDQITQVEAEKGNLSIESRAALSSGSFVRWPSASDRSDCASDCERGGNDSLPQWAQHVGVDKRDWARSPSKRVAHKTRPVPQSGNVRALHAG